MTTPIHAISYKIHPHTKEPFSKFLVESNKTQLSPWRKQLVLKSIYDRAFLIWVTTKKTATQFFFWGGQESNQED